MDTMTDLLFSLFGGLDPLTTLLLAVEGYLVASATDARISWSHGEAEENQS